MNRLNRILALAAVAAAFVVGGSTALAQPRGGGGGGFDPEQFRQRMMDRYREQLGVTGDAEWKIVEERINKVNEARREAGGGRNMFMGRRGGGGGGGGAEGGGGGNGNRGNRGGFGGSPSAEAEALQKAIDAKASPDEIKAKLAKYRDAQKAKHENLTKAQDDLRKVLNVRQEASAVLMGLLE
jgi:hypothetical protein